MILPFDFHTHRLDAGEALISVDPRHFAPEPGKWYSVGYHPWYIGDESGQPDYALLERCASHPQVLAIGETGLDSRRGPDMALQREAFARHLSLAATVGKPVVVHMVKTSQQVLELRRTMGFDTVPLVIHGMRANERVARQLLDGGCYLSFGMRFNPAALQATPLDLLLIETDDDASPIEEVAAAVAAQRGITADELISQTRINARRLLLMP